MKRIYSAVTHLSWGLLVALLPLTSLTLLSKAAGGTDVAPISALFLAILVVAWLIPALLKGKGFPAQAIPLLIFFCIALVSSMLAFFLPLPTYRDVPIFKNELPNILTLALGICFYLVTALWLDDEGKLRSFFRIVNLSGVVMLAYAAFQSVFVIVLMNVPASIIQIQDFFVSSQTTFFGRLNAFAFEPSWLAHQLNMFYLPIWLGLSIKGISFHKFRLFKLSLENILLAAGFVVLFLTKSRIGWLGCLAYLGYLFLRMMNSLRRRWRQRRAQPISNAPGVKNDLFNFGFWFLLSIVLIGVVIGAGWILTKIDPKRMSELFNIQVLQQLGFLAWASRIEFAERIVYWIAGFSVFLLYPILGVGLGNVGYFIPGTMNIFGFKLPEVLRIYLSNSVLPNAKNLWSRLLAETGIVGFSVFIAWLWAGWKTARDVERREPKLAQAMGIMGQIVIIGLIFEGFSVDTFALPYYWMTLGIVVAASRVFLLQPTVQEAEKSKLSAE